MTKKDWKIDSKLRNATHKDGSVVSFAYLDGQWFMPDISTPSEPKYQEALSAWNAALDEAISIMTEAGESMYGHNWVLPTSRDLEVNVSSLQRWLTKERPLTMDHPIWKISVPAALQARAIKQLDLVTKIKKRLLTAETITSGRYVGANHEKE